MLDICNFMQVTAAKHEEVLKAIKRKEFEDFEDCLQDRCAKAADAQYIIIRNAADFINSDVQAISPENFLYIFEKQQK